MNSASLNTDLSLSGDLDAEALARLFLRYGIGQGEQAAIRAFGRIISSRELADALLDRFGLTAGGEDPGLEPAAWGFCETLAGLADWDFSPAWLNALVARWTECHLAGVVTEFPFIAVEALVGECQARLFGERDMVYRLEMDILTAIVRLGWCLGGLLADVSVEREQAYRICAEEGDPVLGIPNRRRFLSLLEDHFRPEARGRHLGLVVVEVEWGRSADVLALDERDQLRLALSETLRGALRSNDILCALGESQWAAILPDLHTPAQVSLAGNRLVDACEVLRVNEYPELRGRFCAGGAWVTDETRDPLSLEQAARSALVVAKASGRLFDVYCADVAVTAERDAWFEQAVARALEAQQFEVWLQPQVELPSRRVVGAEALLRWRGPDGVQVAPPEVIRVLERIGLMGDLSRWVIQQAVQLLASLAAAGCPLRVSVNLVAEDLRDPELPLFVRQTCETWHVPVSRLCFELTEGSLVCPDEVSAQTLDALVDEGGCFSLDDFGTGYSSMDYLRRLPVAELKLHKSFVERVTASSTDRAIVELMIRIAHTFGLVVVAEGVEDVIVESAVAELGCNCAQGFLYAQAMPLDTFVEWWKTTETATGTAG